eukprot:5179622-Prymnesium_polylepis.3
MPTLKADCMKRLASAPVAKITMILAIERSNCWCCAWKSGAAASKVTETLTAMLAPAAASPNASITPMPSLVVDVTKATLE